MTFEKSGRQAERQPMTEIPFRKVAIWMLIVWWLVPGLVWASRPIIHSSENSFQELIGQLFLWSPVVLFPVLLLATAFLLWEGFRYRRSTKGSPKEFRVIIYMSIAGFCGCVAGVALFVNSL